MTYCFFSAQYPPRLGGVENHTRRLAEKIMQKGGRAIVVTSLQPGTKAQERSEAGVEVYRLPSFAVAGGRLPVLKPGREARQLFACLAGQGIDRIVIQTRLYVLSLAGASFAKKHHIPAIVLEHGHAYTVSGNPVVDWGLKCYTSILLRMVHRRCPHFYAISQSASGWLEARGITVLGRIPNALSADALRLALRAPRRNFPAECGLVQGEPTVAYAGRLVAPKGIRELWQAVQMYNSQAEKPLHLLVAGEGELEGELQQANSPFLHFLGNLSFEEVIALFSEVEVVCMPSGMLEGMPSTILEAGGCGAFVLATGQGGTAELIPGPEYGLLVEDNRPDTLAAALKRALAEEAYRKHSAQRLQQHIMAHFTFDALYDILENLPWEAYA